MIYARRNALIIAILGAVLWHGTVVWAAETSEIDAVEVMDPSHAEIKEVARVAAHATLALGQDDVAVVSLLGSALVITGEKQGSTNLVLLDQSGRAVLRAAIEVASGKPVNVRLYNGTTQDQSYECSASSCAPASPVTAKSASGEGAASFHGPVRE
jgi:hypothetical protein